jgi:type VI secretion system protein ImpE
MTLIEGTIGEMMSKVTVSVKSRPADASARMQLFRLLAINGQWSRAENQLDVAGNLDKTLALTVLAHRHALNCEQFRKEVFAGTRAPLFLGEPDRGSALLAQALTLADAAAQSLRTEAMDSLATSAGSINAEAFDWLSDADSRLGPTLEVYLDGKYYWVPFTRVQSLTINEPTDVLDLVWASAELTLRGGVPQAVLLPTRYPGSELSDDDALRLARRTDWIAIGDEQYRGLGQRMFASNQSEVALLDTRIVQFA